MFKEFDETKEWEDLEPIIKKPDQTLREICDEKARSIYGEQLPEIVAERLEQELASIISNGYDILFLVARKVVRKFNEEGYPVNYRYAVGSSLAAAMAGITEVNPLPPHYRCASCFYTDFDSEEVKKYSGSAGCDMPDKLCPKCGQPLIKDGFDIPFETFLGYAGTKKPNVILDFPEECKRQASVYAMEIFGVIQENVVDKGKYGEYGEKCGDEKLKIYNASNRVLTRIHMMEELTGTDAKDIPFDDRKVMSLFRNTEALGITPEDIGGCKLGCLGIPGFGNDCMFQMLEVVKPCTFSELLRICGLSHGTNVWMENAQKFIAEGKADISTAICTRDDIMTYLTGRGMDKELSFTIMESMRKGEGLKEEWALRMREYGVEDWYIESCNLIKYISPKAHAVAYAMTAYRIAWYKLYYPLAYYAAFFSTWIGIDYGSMCMGKESLEKAMQDYEERKDALWPPEQFKYRSMKIVQEMYARGFAFMPIDIYKAKATRFQIMDSKLLPSFVSIMGENAAIALEEAAREGEFATKVEIRKRAGLWKGPIDAMSELGILDGIPEGELTMGKREEQIAEAVERLILMEADEEDIRKYKEEQEIPCCHVNHEERRIRRSSLTKEQKDVIADVEKEKGLLVYYAVIDRGTWMDGSTFDRWSFFAVSSYKEDWDMERKSSEHFCVYAYVYNCEVPEYSEFGELLFRNVNGIIMIEE